MHACLPACVRECALACVRWHMRVCVQWVLTSFTPAVPSLVSTPSCAPSRTSPSPGVVSSPAPGAAVPAATLPCTACQALAVPHRLAVHHVLQPLQPLAAGGTDGGASPAACSDRNNAHTEGGCPGALVWRPPLVEVAASWPRLLQMRAVSMIWAPTETAAPAVTLPADQARAPFVNLRGEGTGSCAVTMVTVPYAFV